MLWKFTCYNGTTWEPKTQCLLTDAIAMFKRETGLHEADIKSVVNQH